MFSAKLLAIFLAAFSAGALAMPNMASRYRMCSCHFANLLAQSSRISSRQVNTGGVAAFFSQNGESGACGTVHSDSDFIAAVAPARYGNPGVISPLCGKRVQITNTGNGKSVTATIADFCAACQNENDLDLSVGAFTQIATEEDSNVPISWILV